MDLHILMGRAVRAAIQHGRDFHYDRRHRATALKAVAQIARNRGGAPTPQQRRLVREYATEILGSPAYAPWLLVYTLIRGEFRDGWIPANFFGRRVIPKLNKRLGEVTNIKTLTNLILRTDAFPDLAYHIDGKFYDRDMSPIGIEQLRDLVEAAGNAAFVKLDGSRRGQGIATVTAAGIDVLFRSIGNCAIQRRIEQHAALEEIISGSVATIRVKTVRDPDGIAGVRAAYLRLGRAGSSWVESETSIRVAIVSADGQLDTAGYAADWARSLHHPDSGFRFEGFVVPGYPAATELALRLHATIPHLNVVGWDLATCADETVRLIEWNGAHCDIKFSEASTGPCFTGLGWERLR